MTLKKLLQSNSWLSVSTILAKLYPNEEKNREGYESVFEKLTMMDPKETDMTIMVKTEKDFDDEEYVDVSGIYNHPKNEEEKFSQAIEFTPWEQWLGMNISAESLKDFSELEILAHCLYEMTFMGFEEGRIQQELDHIEMTKQDYEMMTDEEKRENTTSLDELLDELKENDEENEH